MAYTTATEDAKRIRTELKAKGITSRQVSVRAQNYSLGSSINVTVKDPDVNLNMVKELAETAERISRCEYSGEILSGGNRFIHASYSSEALEILADRVRPAVEAAIAKIHDNYLIPVDGTPYMVGFADNGWHVTVWHTEKSGCVAHAYNKEIAPEVIGRLIATS